ncbi:MAG: hypothetical protein KAG10_10295, partial [Methylococcales bacterium]|nr:hypothetical protein [Methylococcales bacterium]
TESSIISVIIKQAYSKKIEAQMLNFYNILSKKDRRRYAASSKSKIDLRSSYLMNFTLLNFIIIIAPIMTL